MNGLGKRLRVIGPGRAGSSFATALASVGWTVHVWDRDAHPGPAARDVDLVLITTPDAQIQSVASQIEPTPDTVVAHAAGSLGLDVLAGHARVGAIHPLMSLSNAELGAQRLLDAGWFAVAGDQTLQAVVEDLGGRWFVVADTDRAIYHAAACVASPHVVALLGQVERLAASIGVPAEAFWSLTRGSLNNVEELGAHRALTGPAARGDVETIARHLSALPDAERATYQALVSEAEKLAATETNKQE